MTKDVKNNWIVYLIRCSDDTYYCGVTNNLEKRIKDHNAGKGAIYTRGRLPVELVVYKKNLYKKEAYKLEWKVKQQKRKDKKRYIESQ